MDSTETKRSETAPELSLFLPVLDEEENLRPMHETGAASHHKELWTLLVFQLWSENFLNN